MLSKVHGFCRGRCREQTRCRYGDGCVGDCAWCMCKVGANVGQRWCRGIAEEGVHVQQVQSKCRGVQVQVQSAECIAGAE